MKVRVSAIFLALVVSASAQRSLKNIPDPDPKVQIESFKVADGFEINLFASDPMIAKPVQMNWDGEGRLWVVSSGVYPHIKPGQSAEDKVIVLEDRDGDGRADHHTVFAEGLLIPTAVIPGDGGVYVGNSTELLHLKDTDGDGHADQRRIVLSGFGTEDTHHIIHTLRWGPGGDLYFNQSIYIHSHIETPHGPQRLLAGGVWRLRPETMELNVFNRGLINSWGTQFDRWGQWFQTDGAGSDGINYVFPGTVMRTAKGYSRIVRGLNPGQPKHCGLEIVSGEHFPEAWQDRLITCDFRGNRINSFRLKEANSAYVSTKQEDVVSSSSVAFRPIDVRMGPDGALYIADWYNPIIQHGEVDFRDERRDHTHGRIWRVTAKDRALAKRPQIVGKSIAELLELLKSPAEWVRNQARLEIKKQRGQKGSSAAVAAWVSKLDRSDANFEQQRLEGLWALQQMRAPQAGLLDAVLKSTDHRSRAAGVRVLSDWLEDLPNGFATLQAMVADPHPRVRLEVVNALRLADRPAAVQSAMKVLNHDMDEYIDFALWRTLRDMESDWLPALSADPKFFDSDLQAIIFAAKATDSADGIKPLVGMLGDEHLSASDRQAIVSLVGEMGSSRELRGLFDRAVAAPGKAQPYLAALSTAAKVKKRRPSGDLKALAVLLEAGGSVGEAAAELAGLWKVPGLMDKLVALVQHPDTAPGLRTRALEGLSGYGKPAQPVLSKVVDTAQDPMRKIHAIRALFKVAPVLAATKAVQFLQAKPAKNVAAPLVSIFLQTKGGPALMVKQLEGQQIPSELAVEGIQVIARSGRKEPALLKALETSGNLQPIAQGLSGAEMAVFVKEVQERGRPAQGEAIYRRESLLCLNCHAIGGSGGQVGPDLTSIGASAPIDYIVESLLEPMKKIKEGYHVTMLTRKSGAVAAGVLLNESGTTAFLRDGGDNLIEVPKADIAKREIVPTSLMPAGLTGQLRRDEFVDLVAFLARLGKPGAYNVGQGAVVRTWQSLTGDRGEIDEVRHAGAQRPASGHPGLNWRPAYSLVSGELPLPAGLTRFRNIGGIDYFFVRFEFDAKLEGNVMLDFNDPVGLEVWLDKKQISEFDEKPLPVTRGMHWVTVGVRDQERRGKSLQIHIAELDENDASPVLTGGK